MEKIAIWPCHTNFGISIELRNHSSIGNWKLSVCIVLLAGERFGGGEKSDNCAIQLNETWKCAYLRCAFHRKGPTSRKSKAMQFQVDVKQIEGASNDYCDMVWVLRSYTHTPKHFSLNISLLVTSYCILHVIYNRGLTNIFCAHNDVKSLFNSHRFIIKHRISAIYNLLDWKFCGIVAFKRILIRCVYILFLTASA